MLKVLRCNWRLSVRTVSLAALLVSYGTASAAIGFRRITPLDQMVDPVRFPPHIGLSSTIWDTSAVDSALADSALVDSLLDSTRIDTLVFDSLTIDTVTADTSTSDTLLSTAPAPDISPDSTQQKPSEIVPDSLGLPSIEPPGMKTGLPDAVPVDVVWSGKDSTGNATSAVSDTTEPPPWHPTNIGTIGMILEVKSSLDSATGFITFTSTLNGSDIAMNGALPSDDYMARKTALFDRANRRQSILSKLPTAEKKEGLGLIVEVPVFKSKRAQRIFGGPNIGLTVSGAIQIDGSLTTEKKNEVQADNKNPTNYAFKINQKQQFNIKGKVGEKVSVEIDQDSEKLFEFENSLRVRYKGEEDEIIQSVEAGNVSLSLGGSRLATASSNHKGLFGFKTESKLGALKLTTIASLDKGEKNSKKISGGAQKSEGVNIKPRQFAQGRYFFLDYDYRENYKYYDANLNHFRTRLAPLITKLDVYKSVRSGEDVNAVAGWAYFDPHEQFNDQQQGDKQHQQGSFVRLEPGTDYLSDIELGWIRLTRSLDNETILAAAWSSAAGTFGDLDPSDNNESNPFILKLLQPKGPQPSDSTWKMMWRNIYDLNATGITEESFSAKITKSEDGGGAGTDIGPEKLTWLAIFDLDLFNVGIAGQDGKIDPMFVNFGLGELRFPDLQPFDPEGWFTIDEAGESREVPIKLPVAERDSVLYSTSPGSGGLERLQSNFTIIVQYSDASSTYSLGFGVLEGSEEVILNGKRLSRGTDYSIDYITGSLTIINKDATAQGADLEIKYETGQIFQLDTQTMLGIRAEYELWENSTIGGTLLHLSQKTVEQRVRVGGEPKENTVWDINTQLRFEPEFLTRAVDWLPLIETDAPSNITFSAEIAQVFPNPNSISSPSTGDPNGVAYIDDFESIKRSTPLGITRRQWTPSSFPLPDSRGGGRWGRQRGRLIWYNPDPIKVSEIWPERETQAQNSTIQVLEVDFQPWWGAWGDPQPAGIEQEKSWGGLMRYLGPGYADQSQSKYIEVWLNAHSARQGTIYFDLGRISEDVIPDGKSNTEDHPRLGFTTGDGTVTKEEDTGIDGKAGLDPNDYSFINGIEYDSLPSYDDWAPNASGNEWRYLNGTEGNGTKSPSDEGGRIPDTEDLSGDGFADGANDFYRYRLDLGEGDLNRYIVGGLGLPSDKDKGWRLYRIPLTDTLSVGKPNFTQFDYVRMWFTGFHTSRFIPIRIASMEIVGNEWREVKVEDDRGGLRDPISVAVINTHDNPEYNNDLPPGVAGDVDPATGLREKEQSLAIRINRLGAGEVGSTQKVLTQKMNLLEYRQLKMYVHGGGDNGALVDHFGRPLDLEMFLKFGSEVPRARSQAHYYEYSQRLTPGWASSNEIIIDLERLASLKFLRESDSTHDYDILPDGDVIRVVGTPSLRNIGFLEIGLKNHGQEITAQDGVEIWVDEMRVSDIYRNSGWAASGETRMAFADLLDLSVDLTQRQADFHNLNERTRNDPADQLTGNFNAELQLGEIFDKPLGVHIPIGFNFRQDVSIPKYKPNSDVKLTSVSGENPGLWRRFMGDLTNANRFRQDPRDEGPIDSLVSTDKTSTFKGGFSKSGKSDNLLTQVTLDNFKINGSFQEIWGRDYKLLLEYSRTSTGAASYVLSMEKPPELQWLGWASNIPVLNNLSESTFRPIPTSLNLSANGSEKFSRTLRRDGVRTGDTTFTIDRSYSTGWRPFPIMNFDFSQTIGSSRVVEDTMRTMAAYRMSSLDSTIFWHTTDSSRHFDTLGWKQAKAKDIIRIKDKLFWKGFGYYFVDDELSQRASGSFNPVFVSWLGTETNYATTYSWRWGKNLGPADRSIRANANFTGTITLRLPQLTSGWKTGNVDPKLGGDQDESNSNLKSGSGKGNSMPGNLPEDFQKMRIPDLGPDGLPMMFDDESDKPSIESEVSIPLEGLPIDTLGLDTLGGDTLTVKKRLINPPNPLLLVKKFISKIRDIQYSYNQTGDVSNTGIAEGQASWSYRLGFTKNPGIDTVKGYFRENFNLSIRNRISTGFDITQNLTINNIEMNFVDNRNYAQQISGSTQRPVFMYFGKDKVSIKKVPSANWGVRWTGWESLPYLKDIATSIGLDHNFSGSQTEQWRQVNRDTTKDVTNVDYEKSFQPLLGITFAWKGGIGTNIRYNWNQTVQDPRTGIAAKSRNTTSSISVTGSYTSRKGFSIPIPVWPFKNRRFDNSTTFSVSFTSNNTKRESARDQGFSISPNGLSNSWSFSPSIDYTFSSAVRGGFRYTYSFQKNDKTSSKSQEFGFTVNISIRG